MSDIERITRLETKQDIMFRRLDEHVQKEEEFQHTVLKRMDELSNEMTKYRGFFGGIMFAITSMVTAVGLWFKFK